MSSTRRRSLLLCALSAGVIVTVTSCGSDDDEPGGADTAADAFAVVVIGDSIPYNAPGDCPGCTGFAEAYGTALEESLDTTVATIAALVPYDSWRGWSAFTDRPAKEAAGITTTVTYALDQRRTALCEEVEAVEGSNADCTASASVSTSETNDSR